MSISTSFATLIDSIQPTQLEVQNALQHAGQIKTRLEHSYRLRSLFPAGSFSRQTNIRRSSDIDLFAVLARVDMRWGNGYVQSSTALDKLRRDLEARYPSSAVSRDVHAIVVCFSDGVNVDVVPATFCGMQMGRPIYNMPDGDGGWMQAGPELHGRYLKEAGSKSGGKLKRTAQLMKFWRECRSPKVPLSSFHIEMLLAHFNVCAGIKSYADCMVETLQLLAQRQCHALQDPAGIAGNIGATRSFIQREIALRSILYSRDHAKEALYAERHGNLGEAKRQWDIVFHGQFPM